MIREDQGDVEREIIASMHKNITVTDPIERLSDSILSYMAYDYAQKIEDVTKRNGNLTEYEKEQAILEVPYSIIVFGPAGTGKSTLITSLLPKGYQPQPESSAKLQSCTKKTTPYPVTQQYTTTNGKTITFSFILWDTPGYMFGWEAKKSSKYIDQIFAESRPVCALFCLPCSTVRGHVDLYKMILNNIQKKSPHFMFAGGIITNMHAGEQEHLDARFEELVSLFVNPIPKNLEGVEAISLNEGRNFVVAVNSKVRKISDKEYPLRNIDVLNNAIMTALARNRTFVINWIVSKLSDRSWMKQNYQKIVGHLHWLLNKNTTGVPIIAAKKQEEK